QAGIRPRRGGKRAGAFAVSRVRTRCGIGMLLGSQISGALYNHLVAGQSVPQAAGSPASAQRRADRHL
ncbi:hypothetical protein FK513_28810, partial [Klebsiella pneumoniae]|nr:hypothetical protein [Klebsiella pneumoniae]